MKKLPLLGVAFFQALGLTAYCLLVGSFFWNANHIFPKMNTFLGPALLLIIFVFSVIVCTLIFAYNAFIIFWEQKNTKKALKLVVLTTSWFMVFGLLVVLLITIFN